MWGKSNPHMLLVGMQAGASSCFPTTLENNMEVLKISKHRSAVRSSNPTPGDIPKGM
jgi:hypothetical protein